MSRRIRIAMLGAYPAEPNRIWGGVQAAYTYLVKGLAQDENLDIHILTFQTKNYAGQEQIQRGNLTTHFMPVYPRFERLRNYRTFQSIVNRKLAKIQPDVVHVQDVAAEAYVALNSGFPTLMTIHGIRREDRKHFSSWKQHLRSYFDTAFIESYCLSHAQHLVAISHYVTDYYQSFLPSSAKIYYIPNAVDEHYFCESPVPDTNIVLFAGRVTPLKRVMDLVQAFKEVVEAVPNAQLRIAGETTSESTYVKTIQQWIKDARLEKHVHLLGPLPEDTILREFFDCNIVALASAQESSPMVIAQAMAAGKPVVATNVGGVGEMLGCDGARGLLVGVGEIQAMAQAIIGLLRNKELQARIGLNGNIFARDKYHFLKVAWQTAEVYRHIALKAI